MARQRRASNASSASSIPERDQELGSMYDYLAKIILLGPSGAGKSCVLHRFVKNEWRVLSSQTIGVEFASKIIKVGTGPRRKRMKLQLWDTAGTERFRSVSRSYYRGAAGAILVYDVSSHASFTALPTFLMDARALASPNLAVLLAGNKIDLEAGGGEPPPTPSSMTSQRSDNLPFDSGGTPGTNSSTRSTSTITNNNSTNLSFGTKWTATTAATVDEAREVSAGEALRWAEKVNVPVATEVSALSGENIDELFERLARIILTKIELGEIDPDDPTSGIQYGDGGTWDAGSVKSGMTLDDGSLRRRRGRRRRAGTGAGWMEGMREWEEVFRVGHGSRRSGRCC